MKKTLSVLLAAVTALTMTAANFMVAPQATANMGAPVKMSNVKKAPAGMQAKMAEKFAAKLKASPNFPASTAADLVGGYQWAYRQYTGNPTTQPDTLAADKRDQEDNISIVAINKVADDSIRLTGFMPLPVGAKMGTVSNYTTFTLGEDQVVYYHSSYGACTLKGVWYYEGDDTYSAGWYYGDVMGILVDEGIVMDPDVHFYLVIQSGTYANYRLGWIYEPNSVMVPDTTYNGLMTNTYTHTTSNITATYDYPVILSEDENCVVSVGNFADYGDEAVVKFNLAADKTFEAPAGQVFYTSTATDDSGNTINLNYTFYGMDEAGEFIESVTGTGTENVLTFGSNWTGYDTENGYWMFNRSATTITRLDDAAFVYPSETVEPALYLIGSFNNWDEQNMVALTKGEDGKWTTTQEMAAGAEFKFKNEAGEWLGGHTDDGGSTFLVTEEQVTGGTELTMDIPGVNFVMPVAGTWTLTVDKENNKVVISGEWVNPQPEKDHVYILGEVNGNSWAPNVGAEMASEDGVNFTADVTCSANNSGYSYFSFTTKLAENADDWAGILAYRMGATANDFEVTDELMGTELTVQAGTNAFKIADGEYTLALNLETMKLVVTKKAAPAKVGDVTGDGKVDIDDVDAVIKIILNKAQASDYPGKADVDDSNSIDVDDVDAIIKIMLGKA